MPLLLLRLLRPPPGTGPRREAREAAFLSKNTQYLEIIPRGHVIEAEQSPTRSCSVGGERRAFVITLLSSLVGPSSTTFPFNELLPELQLEVFAATPSLPTRFALGLTCRALWEHPLCPRPSLATFCRSLREMTGCHGLLDWLLSLNPSFYNCLPDPERKNVRS